MKSWFKLSQLLSLTLLIALFTVISCQKEKSGNGSENQQEMEASRVSSEADGEAESIFNGIFDDAIGVNDQVGIGGTGVFGRVAACPDVTITPLTAAPFPVKVTLDFGVNGCVGNDGHFRKGKIITIYTNRLLIPGAEATTEFDNFYFDSIKVEGVHKITNTSAPQNTPPERKFKVEVINGKLTRPNGNFIEWNSVKTITQIAGLDTVIPLDDVFRVEGASNGKVKRGNLIVLWQSTITEPLIKRFNCRWIVKGRIRTLRANTNTTSPWVAVLDFGNGNCDNHAILTINGVPHQITLP